MTRRLQLNEFLDRIYIPVDLREEVAQLRRIIAENDYRAINDKDANTKHLNALVIETSGCGLRETYKEFHICRVDVGKVGKDMADIAIYYRDCDIANPQRVSKRNIKFNLLQE